MLTITRWNKSHRMLQNVFFTQNMAKVSATCIYLKYDKNAQNNTINDLMIKLCNLQS